MRLTNKLVALSLSLIMAIMVLGSCTVPTGPLQSDTYAANVEIKFSSEDAAMQSVIDSMSRTSTVYVSGDDMKIETSAEMSGISVVDNYVYYSGTLYHENRITVADKTAVTLERTVLSEENRDQLISDAGAGASIEASDFNLQDKSGEEGDYTYNCSRITSKAKESLEKIYGERFASVGATLKLDAAEYILVVESDRNESSTLTCHFTVTMNGQSYAITMEIVTDYDYDAVFGISVPASSSSYVQVGYDEMFK